MYVTDTPVIDRLINPEPMEELYCVHDDMVERVLNFDRETFTTDEVLVIVAEFNDLMATRLAAIQ